MPESVPASLRGCFDGPRRAAGLILRLAGPDGTADDRRELDELLVAPRLAPWHWVKRDAGQAYRKWTDDRVPVTADERRHKRQKIVAENAVRGWIGSPVLASEIEAARSELSAIVDPLVLPDQAIVTMVTARLLGGRSSYPDGSEWPDPFDGAPQDVNKCAEQIRPVYLAALMQLARRIAVAGVGLDPNDPAVLLVLAQLALLPVDLTRPPADLVRSLNIWPPGFIDLEAAVRGQVATWSSRHGRSARFQRDLLASAEAIARRLGPPAIRAPYSGGHKRATRRDTLQLEKALAVLVAQDPSLTPRSLLGAAGDGEHPALQRLRAALGVKGGWQPEQRRIERLWPKSRH